MFYFPIVRKVYSVSDNFDCIEAVRKLLNNGNNQYIVSVHHASRQNLSLTFEGNDYLWKNSFIPSIDMNLVHDDTQTLLMIHYHLRKSVQTLYYIYFCIGIVMQFALLITCVSSRHITFAVFIPVGLLLFVSLMSYVGIQIHSILIIKQMRDAGMVLLSPHENCP